MLSLSNARTTSNWALACITSTLKDAYMKTMWPSEYNKENHGEAKVDPAKADAASDDGDGDDLDEAAEIDADVDGGGEDNDGDDKDANVGGDAGAGDGNGANVCGGASESAGDTTGYCNFVSDNMTSDSPWILSATRFHMNGWATFLKEHQEAERQLSVSKVQLN